MSTRTSLRHEDLRDDVRYESWRSRARLEFDLCGAGPREHHEAQHFAVDCERIIASRERSSALIRRGGRLGVAGVSFSRSRFASVHRPRSRTRALALAAPSFSVIVRASMACGDAPSGKAAQIIRRAVKAPLPIPTNERPKRPTASRRWVAPAIEQWPVTRPKMPSPPCS